MRQQRKQLSLCWKLYSTSVLKLLHDELNTGDLGHRFEQGPRAGVTTI
jgi:hypothetical protein